MLFSLVAGPFQLSTPPSHVLWAGSGNSVFLWVFHRCHFASPGCSPQLVPADQVHPPAECGGFLFSRRQVFPGAVRIADQSFGEAQVSEDRGIRGSLVGGEGLRMDLVSPQPHGDSPAERVSGGSVSSLADPVQCLWSVSGVWGSSGVMVTA